MSSLRTWSGSARAAWAVLLALLLGLRLLGATGYMPAQAHGAFTIIVCPDADVNTPLALGDAHHHHGGANHDHGTCPYAWTSALGALGTDYGPILDVAIASIVLLLGQACALAERPRPHERPPLRGPPVPA